MFINTFLRTQIILTSTRQILFMPPHPISVTSNIICAQVFQVVYFFQVFLPKPCMRHRCHMPPPPALFLLDLTTRKNLCCVRIMQLLIILLLPCPIQVHIFFSALYYRKLSAYVPPLRQETKFQAHKINKERLTHTFIFIDIKRKDTSFCTEWQPTSLEFNPPLISSRMQF